MATADCEICGVQGIARSSKGTSAHSKYCPLGTPNPECLKSEVAGLLRSTPFDIDLRATSRPRVILSQEIHEYLENDRVQYENNEDFDLAPFDAYGPHARKEVASVKVYIDETGSLRLTQCGMLEEARRRKRPLTDPLRPQFGDRKARMSTFDGGRDFNHMSAQDAIRAIERYARNGFYMTGEEVVECFHCGVSFNRGMLEDDAWNIEREHARWSPYCAHLLHRKGRDFVCDVLEETKRIYKERNGLDEGSVMEEALSEECNNNGTKVPCMKGKECPSADIQYFFISNEASWRSEQIIYKR